MFKVELETSLSEIDDLLGRAEKETDDLIKKEFSSFGLMCVKEATDRAEDVSWYNQSGDLRGSIGCVGSLNGKITFRHGFEQVKQGVEGARAGKTLAIELIKEHTEGYALVVVAGMRYAVLVEAMENKVVLASSELLARRELPNMVKQLETQIAK